ncbi:MAG: hypothetical protein EHM33_05635 [Chloroflexi bacterium]|nr:MAG: hypothetical protein EHM33_05635 [Chloroflexota bacterium]
MATKPAKRNWDDVQTAIATAAIVTTLGMWNLFATPAKAEEVEAVPTPEKVPAQPALPPAEPPVGFPIDVGSAALPKVKIMFTQIAPQTTTMVQQPQQEKKKRKKKNKDNNSNSGGGGGGGGEAAAPVTQTQSS